MEGISLIMVDEIDWGTLLGPQWIVGYDMRFLPVYIGQSLYETDSEKSIGLYVNSEDYDKINHSRPYYFIHDIYVTEDEVRDLINEIEKKTDEQMTGEDKYKVSRMHFHIGPEIEEQLAAKEESQYVQ